MEFDDAEDLQQLCVDRLGDAAGRQFAMLARPGFRLDPVGDGAVATGRCRAGGPALLEPGTPWPEHRGVPLSLHMILDTDHLTSWLGNHFPRRPGLLNFFYLDPDLPYEEFRHLDMVADAACRVIPAAPSRAVETPAPPPARSYPGWSIRATPVAMLPDAWDVVDSDLECDADWRYSASLLILERFEDLDGNSAEGHRAFGWPGLSHASPVLDRNGGEPYVHLLQLDEDDVWGWGEAATLYFVIPAGAYEVGDFSRAKAVMRSC